MRKTILALAFLFIAAGAGALDVDRHSIDIAVDAKGYAVIAEQYALKFANQYEFSEFRETANENGSSLLAWGADYNFFYPRFGGSAGINRIAKSSVSFDEGTRTLTLGYELESPFAQIVKDEPRSSLWRIPDRAFSLFQQGGIIIVPENTAITITLPPNAEVVMEGIPAHIAVSGNTVTASAMSTNFLNLQYTLPKPIAPSMSSFELVQNFLSGNGIMVAAALAVALVVVFIYRKRISERVEDYIVEHSEIKHAEPEEEEFTLEE